MVLAIPRDQAHKKNPCSMMIKKIYPGLFLVAKKKKNCLSNGHQIVAP